MGFTTQTAWQGEASCTRQDFRDFTVQNGFVQRLIQSFFSLFFFFSSCEATAIIVLVILSLYGESAAKKKFFFFLDYCSLEALDTNVSMVLASMTYWGRSFQSLMVLGWNEYCWYWVLQCGCEKELLVGSSSLTLLTSSFAVVRFVAAMPRYGADKQVSHSAF